MQLDLRGKKYQKLGLKKSKFHTPVAPMPLLMYAVTPYRPTPADLKRKALGVQSIGGGVWTFRKLALDYWACAGTDNGPVEILKKLRGFNEQNAF